jgi:hypothetical protein
MDVFNDWRWRKLYKNVKEKLYAVDKEFMGKVLVKDSLVNYQWKLEAKLELLVGTIVLNDDVRPASN